MILKRKILTFPIILAFLLASLMNRAEALTTAEWKDSSGNTYQGHYNKDGSFSGTVKDSSGRETGTFNVPKNESFKQGEKLPDYVEKNVKPLEPEKPKPAEAPAAPPPKKEPTPQPKPVQETPATTPVSVLAPPSVPSILIKSTNEELPLPKPTPKTSEKTSNEPAPAGSATPTAPAPPPATPQPEAGPKITVETIPEKDMYGGKKTIGGKKTTKKYISGAKSETIIWNDGASSSLYIDEYGNSKATLKDEKGNIIRIVITIKDADGNSEETILDEHGNATSTKYYDKNGKFIDKSEYGKNRFSPMDKTGTERASGSPSARDLQQVVEPSHMEEP